MRNTVTAFTLLLAAVMALSQSAEARKQSTSQGRLHPRPTATTRQADAYETVDSLPGLSLYGYDKPLSASSESFYAVNRSDADVGLITVEFSYFDMSGRLLHKAEHTIRCLLPASETRKLSVPTWDRQHSLYYHKSTVPRRSATPYTVAYTIKAVGILPDED